MSDPEKEDIRKLMKTIQPELPDVGNSSIMSDTSIITSMNDTSYLRDHKSLVCFEFGLLIIDAILEY